jgi:tRNA-2-methylthio-N6-dimethylallyladenosine synthase
LRRPAEARTRKQARPCVVVVFEGNPQRHTGEIFNVRITEADHFTLYGDPVLS